MNSQSEKQIIESTDFNEGEFVQLISSHQQKLYAYILVSIRDRQSAQDILQEVNLVLWNRRHEFEWGSRFTAWARKVAFYQILAFRRDAGRDRHVFCEELLERIEQATDKQSDTVTERMEALHTCMETLPERQRNLLKQRYALNSSVKEIADLTGKTSNSIAITIHRIRNSLRTCINVRLHA